MRTPRFVEKFAEVEKNHGGKKVQVELVMVLSDPLYGKVEALLLVLETLLIGIVRLTRVLGCQH